MSNLLTKDQIKSLQKDYLDGIPCKELYEKYNISQSTLHYHCKKLKSERNNKRISHKLSKEDIENIRREYADNIIPVKDILAKYNITNAALYMHCAGLPRRQAGKQKSYSQEIIDKIKEDYYTHQLPVSEIILKYNIKISTLYYYCSMNRTRKLSDEEISGIIKDIQDGKSIKDITLKYNICPSVVTKYHRTIIEDPIANYIPHDIIDSMRDDAKKGMGCKELMSKYHYCDVTIYKYCGDIIRKKK